MIYEASEGCITSYFAEFMNMGDVAVITIDKKGEGTRKAMITWGRNLGEVFINHINNEKDDFVLIDNYYERIIQWDTLPFQKREVS